MVVSFNFYYGRPGVADQVLAQRLRASDVRVRIGLPYGRVMSRTLGGDELPDVIWEQEFAEVGGHHADMATRAASPAFEAIRAGMRPLLRRFERPLFEVCGEPGLPAARSRVVALDWIFCAPEEAADVLAVLEKHARRGAGRRLLRLITPGADLPGLVWQHDDPDASIKELVRGVRASTWQLASQA